MISEGCCCKLLEDIHRLVIVQNKSAIHHVAKVLYSKESIVGITRIIYKAHLKRKLFTALQQTCYGVFWSGQFPQPLECLYQGIQIQEKSSLLLL